MVSEGKLAKRYSNLSAREYIVSSLQSIIILIILLIIIIGLVSVQSMNTLSTLVIVPNWYFYILGATLAATLMRFLYIVIIMPRLLTKKDYEKKIARKLINGRLESKHTVRSLHFLVFVCLVLIPVVFGYLAPYVTTKYDAIGSNDKDTKRMVIDVIGGTNLVVKNYDYSKRKFMPGYEIVKMDNQTFYNISIN